MSQVQGKAGYPWRRPFYRPAQLFSFRCVFLLYAVERPLFVVVTNRPVVSFTATYLQPGSGEDRRRRGCSWQKMTTRPSRGHGTVPVGSRLVIGYLVNTLFATKP